MSGRVGRWMNWALYNPFAAFDARTQMSHVL